MGGRISVRSEVGKGSTFSFTARFGVAEHPPVVEDVPDADLAGMKVLVVDDNATNRTILTECLSSWGLSVREAPGGAEALRELEDHHQRGHPFALLLLDRAMPDVDGFAVAERIQSAAHLVRTTVVMLTSAGARGDAARCKELGIDAYLLKPVRQSELRDAIVSALARGPRDDAEGRAPVTRYTIREARRKLRVLLAEDNVVNQRLAMRLLEKAGHVVTVVGDGRAAIEATESGAFDVVLMDVQMPEVDGVEATGAIREREKQTGRHTPIIALTAHAMAEDERRCLEAGMDAYVTKPIRADVLFEAIGKVIGE